MTKARAPRQTKSARLKKRVDGALEQLARGDLVKPLVEADPAYSFKHALMQDTARSTLLHDEFKRLNLLVAHAYEKIYADRCMDEFAGRLAQHYADAGDDANTLAYALRAGDVAASAYANTEAITSYDLALDAARRGGATTAQLVHLYTKRGRVYEITGRDPVAFATYEEMGAFARKRNDLQLELEALIAQAKLRSVPSVAFDRAQAFALSAQAEQRALALGNREAQARIRWTQLMLHHYSGEIEDAIRCGEEAMNIAREVGARELLAYILGDLARARLSQGRMAQVAALEEEARAIWRALDNKPMLADNLMQAATRTLLRGDYDRTLALTDEGITISRAIDSKLSLLSNMGTQIFPNLERGEFAHALQIVNEILRVSLDMKLSFNGPLAYCQSAWTYGILGAFERGADIAQTAREILNQSLPEFFRKWGWVMIANFYLECGDLDAAQQALDQAQIENEQQFSGPATIYGIIALGNYYYARGEFARAAEQMARFANMLRQFGIRASLHEALLIQAKAVYALGDRAQAFALVQQARQVAEQVQSRRLLWQIYALLGERESERGNYVQANAYREQARDVLDFIVVHTPEEFRASFLNLPNIKRILNNESA